MDGAAARLVERLESMSEDEREALARKLLEELDERDRILALLAPAFAEMERGEGRPLESHASFMGRMKARYGLRDEDLREREEDLREDVE